MKAVILARVSTREQDEGHSPEAQKARLVEYCQRKGLEVLKTFEIIESSTRGKRKEFNLMIDFINSQKETVALVADAVDRVQRSFKESVLLDDLRRKEKVELHFYREGIVLNKDAKAIDIMMWDYAVMGAKSYVLNLSDNVKRSLDFKIKNGEWLSRAPIGYLNTTDSVTGKPTIVVDSERRYFVIKGFELYSQGTYSMARIAGILKEEGLTNSLPPHKQLHVNQIYNMLTNPFYMGQMRIKGQLHPHRNDTLISKQLFDKCQEVRENWHKKPFKYASKPYVFRGLVKCDKCGRVVTSDTKTKKSGKQYTYVYCVGVKKCGGVRVKEEDLLKQLSEAFKLLGKMPENVLEDTIKTLQNSCESERAYHQQAIDSLRSEYDKLQNRFDALLDMRLDKSITDEDYTKKVYEMKQRQLEIDDLLKQHTKADEEFALTVTQLLNVSHRAAELYESSNVEEKRQLINFMLSNLRLKGNKLLWDYKKPFDAMALCSKNANWFRD